jgi:hypothetical protein
VKDLYEFEQLSTYDQMLVCVAVLIDGLDAAEVLGMDTEKGESLRRIARELASASPDIRMPLIGTLLRLNYRGESQ